MFGEHAFGELPFSSFREFLTRANISVVAAANAEYRILAATHDYISKPTDTLPNTPFWGTLQKSIRIDRSIVNGGRFGKVVSSIAEFELINADGYYDDVVKNYSIDGCPIYFKILRFTDSYNDAISFFKGTGKDWNVEEDVLRIEARDNEYLLDVPAQPNIYGGTGGLDGGEDLEGKRKPRAFGDLSVTTSNGNISPPLIDSVNLVYQVNDGRIEAITAVYDRGAALTFDADYATSALMLAAVVASGHYVTCLAEGYFRLGGIADGMVTADVKGDKTGGTYVNTSGTIIRRLISSATSIADPAGLYAPSFTALETAQPAVIGYWLDQNSTASVKDVIDALFDPIGAYCGFRRSDGLVDVGVFLAPSGVPTARYTNIEIISITREKLPSGLNPIPWRFRVEWGRNWTKQDDVAGSVTAERQSYLSEEVRVATSTDTTTGAVIQASHPLAQDPAPINGYFRDAADALAEADRLFTLYSATTRSLYRITLKLQPFVHNLCEVIHVTYPRWDLVDGRLMRIVGLSEDTGEAQVEILAFG